MAYTVSTLDSAPPLAGDLTERLRNAAETAASWPIIPRSRTAGTFPERVRAARSGLRWLEKHLVRRSAARAERDPHLAPYHAAMQDLRANFRLLRSAIAAAAAQPRHIAALPRIVQARRSGEPRMAAVAEAYLRAVDGDFSAPTFYTFVHALQAREQLTADELWNFPLFLKFSLLESLLDESRAQLRTPELVSAPGFSVRLRSLRSIVNSDWDFLIEPLISFDAVLRRDPAGVYARMDFESRELYRKRIAFIARRSDCTESQVAQAAVDLARQGGEVAASDERIRSRLIHVGYYILDKGFPLLGDRVGFHPPISWRLRQFIRSNAEDVYITGIFLFSLLFIAAAVFPILPSISHFIALVIAVVVLLVPATQDAVELVNNLVTSIFDPTPLPKLDFSKGIPPDCATLVAVPSLLLHEKQTRALVNELEVRFLGNRDPNLHFALLTDLPDSVSKPHENDTNPLVELASRLIEELNAKYRNKKGGAFLLLHRHRIYNTRQGVWMGWERKRGKLLDLNQLLTGEDDAFPIKAGGLDALRHIRYILTLDSDTQLPRGAAARMIGAIAHPLNQAVIDPRLRIVTSGYGILQPRVGVSVRSAARSRLAAIYSGQSGFDIYTRAISDAYQDLFGEGIFTGKGIYEVATLDAVLNRRFPRNAILSHDLIEGAYARAGLVTDIELIDDYPSHYSAYSRRQHRWLRGDWQIAQWMFSRVPDESDHWGPNPISDISRWKIFDNLRRSLVDPSLMILFVAGWLGLAGGPLYWTIAPLLLLIFPAVAQLVFALGRAYLSGQKGRARDALTAFWRAAFVTLLHLVLLAQQTCLAFDAILRALIRRFITGERLLEWETAAQAETHRGGRAPVDRYLGILPLVVVALGALVWYAAAQRQAIFCAAPILLLWALANPVTAWLDRPPSERLRISASDRDLLLDHALRIWRYFHEFGTERHNYLIPDNVREEGFDEAPRISPTNIGLLLNARQVACELGFLTVPEFTALTTHTLATIARLDKLRGHLYNWYDTRTLRVLGGGSTGAPFVSSVDSGNLAASLYTLHAGAREQARRPLLTQQLFTGLRMHWRLIRRHGKLPARLARLRWPDASAPISTWIAWLPAAQAAFEQAAAATPLETIDVWWLAETHRRITAILDLLHGYLPWTLPEYQPLRALPLLGLNSETTALSIVEALSFAETLDAHLAGSGDTLAGNATLAELAGKLRKTLPAATCSLRNLVAGLRAIAEDAGRFAQEMEFDFLVIPDRQLLSVGYDAGECKTEPNCYDLIASEARIATFLAIARGDLPQQSWLRLSRDHTCAFGRFILLSWTGTMFEYLMPALWMHCYPATLLARSQAACVDVHRTFARSLNIPWGVSESGYSHKNDAGHYQYHAYGIPQIAYSPEATAGPVISPYSTFLALGTDPPEALLNLRRMARLGWVGPYGLYEAADYIGLPRKPVLVREWMAHHQGMSLLAIANLLCDNVVQTWFHANPIIQSTERLLQEVRPSKTILKSHMDELAPLQIH